MNSNKQNKQNNSDDQLNEQINKKLRQLWSNMKNKKKQFLTNLTPSYSRRTQNTPSQVNMSTNYMIRNTNINNPQNRNKNQLKLKQSQIKIQNSELQVMKKTIQELQNENKTLISQLSSFNQYVQVQNYQQQQQQKQQYKQQLNQSSIRSQKIQENQSQYFKYKNKQKQIKNSSKQKYNGSIGVNKLKKKSSTHNIKKSPSISKNNKIMNKCNNSKKQTKLSSQNKLKKSISTKHNKIDNNKTEQQTIQQNIRLIQLLKSTSQYRQFAYYYDSHQLSYLKRLQIQHNKNCPHNISKQQKKQWAPSDLIYQMKILNKKQQLNLTQKQMEIIISQMKCYFQQNQQSKINKVKEIYKKKIQKIQREKQNCMPYDVVRLVNAKDRMTVNSYQNKKFNKSKSIRS